MWHSGSISTYLTFLWLYPEAGIGIFASIPGPGRYDTANIFFNLMLAISDLVVFDIRPPALRYRPTTPQPYKELSGTAPPRPLSDYVGTYVGEGLLGNATVTLDHDTGDLWVAVGRLLIAELRRYHRLHDEFDAVIGGRLWYLAEGAPQGAILPVRFRSSVYGRRPDVLLLPQEFDNHSRWCRFTRVRSV